MSFKELAPESGGPLVDETNEPLPIDPANRAKHSRLTELLGDPTHDVAPNSSGGHHPTSVHSHRFCCRCEINRIVERLLDLVHDGDDRVVAVYCSGEIGCFCYDRKPGR